MDLLAGGPRERQAQAPEHGLGRGGRSIAGGEDVVAQGRHCEGPGACRWPCPERSPGGARVRGAGQLVEVPCTWEGQGEGEVSRLGGGNAGEATGTRQGRESPSGNARILCWRRGGTFCLVRGVPRQLVLRGRSVGSLTSHCLGLRPPAPASSPPTPLRALTGLWNFPGGNSPQRPSGPTYDNPSRLYSHHPRPPAVLWAPERGLPRITKPSSPWGSGRERRRAPW